MTLTSLWRLEPEFEVVTAQRAAVGTHLETPVRANQQRTFTVVTRSTIRGKNKTIETENKVVKLCLL